MSPKHRILGTHLLLPTAPSLGHTRFTAAQNTGAAFEGKMSVKPKPQELLIVGNLPDQAVLPKAHVAALMNLSNDTLDRLHRRGEGPPRIQLTARRVGYPVGGIKAGSKRNSVPSHNKRPRAEAGPIGYWAEYRRKT
jgi:hypothetical protein